MVGLVLHRLTTFPTPVALNLFLVAFAGAALALLVGLIALVQIWHNGYAGAGSAAIGILLPLLMARLAARLPAGLQKHAGPQ